MDLLIPSFANNIKLDLAMNAVHAIGQLIKIRQQKFAIAGGKKKITSKGQVFDKYPIVKQFFSKIAPKLSEHCVFTFVMVDSQEVLDRFCQQFEVLLVCFTDQFYVLSEDPKKKVNQNIFALVLVKFVKIIHYLRAMTLIRELDITV